MKLIRQCWTLTGILADMGGFGFIRRVRLFFKFVFGAGGALMEAELRDGTKDSQD